MAKEDLLLRATSNPPLTTKGSALSWAELDANWIEIYNAFVALSQSSYVPAYDNAVEYDDTVNNYVTYLSQIWKFINTTPAINVTPTEGATWTKVYATDLVNRPFILDGVKRHKALLSQNAPIASTNNDTMVAGQIWELSGAAHPSDYGTIDAFELVSGTLYANGSKYRVSVDTPFTFSASAMEYDGSPYIVSTDANGDFAPFVNTLGEMPILAYDSEGFVTIDKTGGFDLAKTFVNIGTSYNQSASQPLFRTYVYTDAKIWIDSTVNGLPANNVLYYTPFEIEVYP